MSLHPLDFVRLSLLPVICWSLVAYCPTVAERRTLDLTPRSCPEGRPVGPERQRAYYFIYAVGIDAGSSGTRVRVYRIRRRSWHGYWVTSSMELLKPTLKIRPGLSALANNKTAVREHIRALIRNATRYVPTAQQSATPIYVMATAGMRLLMEEKMNEIMRYIDSLMRDSTLNPFYYESSTSSRILSGEEEGVFAWITANYLRGAFAVGSTRRPVGILEMGGASTQIAFLPRGDVLADKFPVRVNGTRYPLYVHSYLDYGRKRVDGWIKKRLVDKGLRGRSRNRINNPCMVRGDVQHSTEFGKTFVGTGDPNACIVLLKELVYKVEPWKCHPKPCAIGSFCQPSIPNYKTFYAIGGFLYTLRSHDALWPDGTYVPSYGLTKAYEYCHKTLDELLEQEEPDERKYVPVKCLLGLYYYVLLHRGYGFANDTQQIKVLDSINGQSPDWTMGAILYESAQKGCGISFQK